MKHELYREQQLNCDLQTAWDFFFITDEFVKNNPKKYGIYRVV